jgi:hypothetical protein
MRINIEDVYKETGLPRPSKKATKEEREVFMA